MIFADSEKFELVEENNSIIVEKQDEEIIIASKDHAESAQPQSSEIFTDTGASACSESFEKVESVLEDHIGSSELEITSTNEQEKIEEIIAEKIPESMVDTALEICDDIPAENSNAIVEEPSETCEDSSEATAVALTESENEETIISSETIQFSQSEQDLSQAASDLSEINCFKNPMLASSSIEDDLSSEAVANIILESQQKQDEKLSEKKEDEFCSVDSTTALHESAEPEQGKNIIFFRFNKNSSELERSGPRKNSCQIQPVPVLISSRSVDTVLQEDELDADENVIMKTILEDSMTKSEPIVSVSVRKKQNELI